MKTIFLFFVLNFVAYFVSAQEFPACQVFVSEENKNSKSALIFFQFGEKNFYLKYRNGEEEVNCFLLLTGEYPSDNEPTRRNFNLYTDGDRRYTKMICRTTFGYSKKLNKNVSQVELFFTDKTQKLFKMNEL
ncbi:hypothetical protein ACSBL2_17190 [Pedobacter sp. AW31-3R]|uniref:hypothetical protein n=1 Tax=Pedobacter sp. AW31-3R TaxID=3445781 RepID=UPI003FA1906F